MRWLWRWGVPVTLVIGAVACLTVGLVVEGAAREGDAAAIDQGRVATPLLSARRVPTVVAEPVARQRLAADLADWVGVSPMDSCLTVDTGDGEPLFAHRPDVPLRPASAQKLLTAAATLLELGADHRFRTVAVAGGEPVDGVLAGDLFLVGGGDPILASADYAARFRRQPQIFTDLGALADEVAARVSVVDGSVVGDERRYDQVRYVPSWPPRYLAQNQIGPLSGLSVNDGFSEYPSGPDAGGGLEPAADPAADAAAVLTRLLRERGVEVRADPRSGSAPEGAVEIGALDSPPVTDVLRQLLGESDNNTGEMLVKELGLVRAGEGSTAAGRMALAAILLDAGIDLEGVVVDDGSGLSLENRVPCAVLMDLLTRDGTGDAMVEGLAVAGEFGTLRDRFGGELAGRLRAKTGSLNTVTALTGVLDDDDGRLVFAYVANVPDGEVIGPATIALQDGLAQILLGHPRTPDVAELGPRPPEVPDPPVVGDGAEDGAAP